MIENKPIPLECEEQYNVFEWATWNLTKYPELELMYHIVNESNVPVQYRVKLKRMGIKSGTPDICLPIAKKGYNSLYIEMKRTKGSKTSEEQIKRIEMLNKYGNMAVICYGADEAIKTIENYLKF